MELIPHEILLYKVARTTKQYDLSYKAPARKCRFNTATDGFSLTLDTVNSLITDLTFIRDHMANAAMVKLLEGKKV